MNQFSEDPILSYVFLKQRSFKVKLRTPNIRNTTADFLYKKPTPKVDFADDGFENEEEEKRKKCSGFYFCK